MSDVKKEIEEYLVEFLGKSRDELASYLEKAKVYDIKSGKEVKDTKDYDPKLKSPAKGNLKSVEEKDKPYQIVRPRGVYDKVNKSDLYDTLIATGQTESALKLRNWDEIDMVAQELIEKTQL